MNPKYFFKTLVPALFVTPLFAIGQTYRQVDSMVQAKIKAKDLPAALALVDVALKKDSLSYGWYLKRADIKTRTGDYKGAIADYSKYLSAARDAGTFYLRGMTYYMMNDYTHAMADFDDVIKEDNQFALLYEAYFIMGNIKFKQEDIKGSIEYYTKSIELRPKYAKAYYNRGVSKYFGNLKQDACNDIAMAQQLGYSNIDPQIKKYCDYYATHK